MSTRILACRRHNYAPFIGGAYGHLASLGIRHVEIEVPRPELLMQTRAELAEYGLSASSQQGVCDVSSPGLAEQIESQMPALAALQTPILFLSARAGQTPRDTVYARLREAGEVAASHNVTIVLETHPDLVTNAETALATMRGVGHPSVRINYDTANIYFYNQNVDAVAELGPIAEFVAAVHLKDTDGGYRHWHFPALGRGIVDFPRVFEVLDAAGYTGPYTLEIEGLEGEDRTEQLVRERAAESVTYLRSIGGF